MPLKLERRTVLKAGVASLGVGMLRTAAAEGVATGKSAYEFSVKDIVYSKSGGRETIFLPLFLQR